ncbi:MAG: arylsulfatase [Pirellulaceae bacterium]
MLVKLFRRRRVVLGSLLLQVVLVLSEHAQAQVPEKPNIIYIMADDLGYGDLGCYGQKVIKTPNIDRLARNGIRFTDHYSGHTVCRPSRLVLLTGRHSGHTAISANAPFKLQPGARTVTTLLKKAGYATGGVGKWALGGANSTGAPSKQGFDFWFGYLDQGNAHNFYPEYLWKNEKRFPLAGNVVGDKKRVSVKRTTYSHDLLTEEALEFIRANATRPFCLQAHYTIPHANNEGGRATGNGLEVPNLGIYANRDWPATEKGFAAMIGRLDGDVGRLVALLKELGIERKTLVIFTSDNGPHQEGGHKMEFFDSNGPLRGYKRDLYEGGIRVPMIACWPGQIRPGTLSNHPSAFWDFLPTACELAGVAVPQDIDGISYRAAMLGLDGQRRHEYLYWQAGLKGRLSKIAIRQGNWKGVRVGPDKPLELYNLATDIGEQKNLAAAEPAIVKRLDQLIQQVK